jgi:hypothetical protein
VAFLHQWQCDDDQFSQPLDEVLWMMDSMIGRPGKRMRDSDSLEPTEANQKRVGLDQVTVIVC